jgi:hypothetical protein
VSDTCGQAARKPVCEQATCHQLRLVQRQGELGALACADSSQNPADSWASSGGFGKARSHSSAAAACRLNVMQKCRTEARREVQQPGHLEEHEPDPGGGDADGEGSDHLTTMMQDVVATDGPNREHQARQDHRPNTAADASGSPPNANRLPKIKAKTPLIILGAEMSMSSGSSESPLAESYHGLTEYG